MRRVFFDFESIKDLKMNSQYWHSIRHQSKTLWDHLLRASTVKNWSIPLINISVESWLILTDMPSSVINQCISVGWHSGNCWLHCWTGINWDVNWLLIENVNQGSTKVLINTWPQMPGTHIHILKHSADIKNQCFQKHFWRSACNHPVFINKEGGD